jgi:hypothetical protein
MDYTNKSGETIELVVKSVPVLVVGADGREVDEEVMALLPEAMGTMELVGYQEVAGEFLICNVMRDYRLLGAYGGSWSRHAIKVQGGDATGAYLYTVELVLPHRGLDVQCWKEQLWECPLVRLFGGSQGGRGSGVCATLGVNTAGVGGPYMRAHIAHIIADCIVLLQYALEYVSHLLMCLPQPCVTLRD